jgi:hypothetical protein
MAYETGEDMERMSLRTQKSHSDTLSTG